MSNAFPGESLPFARELGWVLLHSLWQGALIAGLASAAFALTRRASAETRYALACAAMLALVLAPLATFFLWPAPSTPAGAVAALAEVPLRSGGRELDPFLHGAAALWLCGALVAQARLALHALRAARLRRTGLSPAPADVERALRELCRVLDVRVRVRVATSNRTSVPAVVGWLAPLVLVPASALSGLSPSEMRAVLAHELAHVRRHDALVNLLQALFEALFFFHPAAWWLSMRARVEREYCCDDLAVRASGDALGFARALARLESLRGESAALALASTGGPLMQRILRLVAPEQRSRGRVSVRGLATLAAAALLGTSALALAPTAQWARVAEPQARQTETQDELAARIDELRARIHELETRIDELRALRGEGAGEPAPPARYRRSPTPAPTEGRRRSGWQRSEAVPAPQPPAGAAPQAGPQGMDPFIAPRFGRRAPEAFGEAPPAAGVPPAPQPTEAPRARRGDRFGGSGGGRGGSFGAGSGGIGGSESAPGAGAAPPHAAAPRSYGSGGSTGGVRFRARAFEGLPGSAGSELPPDSAAPEADPFVWRRFEGEVMAPEVAPPPTFEPSPERPRAGGPTWRTWRGEGAQAFPRARWRARQVAPPAAEPSAPDATPAPAPPCETEPRAPQTSPPAAAPQMRRRSMGAR